MRNAAQNPVTPTPQTPIPETPPATVAGWALAIFGFAPLMMALHGDGIGYGIAAACLLVVGGVLLVIGKLKSRRLTTRQG